MSDSFFAKLRESAEEHGYFAVLTVDFEDEGRDYDRRDEFIDKGFWEYPGKNHVMEDRVCNLFDGDVVLLKTAMSIASGLEAYGVTKPIQAMCLLAAGKVVENGLDGHNVKIEWQRFEEPLNFFALDTKEPIELFKLGQKSDSLDAERALLDFALVEPKQDLEAFLADERWASLKD